MIDFSSIISCNSHNSANLDIFFKTLGGLFFSFRWKTLILEFSSMNSIVISIFSFPLCATTISLGI